MTTPKCFRRFDDEYASWPKGKLSEEWMPKWFGKSDGTDAEIKANFEESIEAIRSGAVDTWLARPLECLAGIILMDQFTRNIYRGTPEMCDVFIEVPSVQLSA